MPPNLDTPSIVASTDTLLILQAVPSSEYNLPVSPPTRLHSTFKTASVTCTFSILPLQSPVKAPTYIP